MANILVVDDESPIREVLTRWLETAGHEVRQAEDASAAIAAMKARAADVVFVDVQMPGPDGLWLTGELRRRFPHAAVVLATGVSTVPGRISMQHGVMAYLLKPFDRDTVIYAAQLAGDWHVEAAARADHADDSADRIAVWLATIDEALDV